MDWFQSIVELAKALAWPGAVLTIALLFREEIAEKIRQLRDAGVAGTTFTFGDAVQRVKQQTADVIPKKTVTLDDPLARLAVSNPRQAIAVAWQDVESAITELVEKHGQGATQFFKDPMQAIYFMAGTIESSQLDLIEKLRLISVRARRQSDLSADTKAVLDYVQMANELTAQIKALAVTKK